MDIDIFEKSLISFDTKFINSTKTILYFPDLLDNKGQEKISSEDFAKKFSYGIFGSECFDEISFSEDENKILYAEKYGGTANGKNAGGARCGNLGAYQIKGCGKNPLSGRDQDLWHSYGGLSLVEGVCEAVSSYILGKFLPLGVVKCYGLIYTGKKTSYTPCPSGEHVRGHGVLLIREKCLRPAHFMRCRSDVENDVERVRLVNKALSRELGSNTEFVKFCGKFLLSCANQFAYARVHGIYHSSISSANISLDGRWLDLTCAGFIDRKKNYLSLHGGVSFDDEPHEIKRIVRELMRTYGKYNECDFNIDCLIKYYDAQFTNYLNLYAIEAIGIPFYIIENCEEKPESVSLLIERIVSLIQESRPLDLSLPKFFSPDDPLVLFIEGVFSSMYCDNKTSNNFIFSKAVFALAAMTNKSNFIKTAAISALKKLYFSDFFYRDRLISVLRNIPENNYLNNVSTKISEIIYSADWVLNLDNNYENIIFKNNLIEVYFHSNENKYSVNLRNQNKSIYYLALSDLIEETKEEFFYIQNYSFYPGIKKISNILDCIKWCPDGDNNDIK